MGHNNSKQLEEARARERELEHEAAEAQQREEQLRIQMRQQQLIQVEQQRQSMLLEQQRLEQQKQEAIKRANAAEVALKQEQEARKQQAAAAEELIASERAAAEKRVAAEREAERARVHAEQLKSWEALNRQYPIPQFLETYITKVSEDFHADASQNRLLNIGVLGNSGTGKSSLIKALLERFSCSTSISQPTSCFEGDGTRAPTPYRLSSFQDAVHLWDLPGQGTKLFPPKSYLRDMGLKYFDVIVVTTDGRWTENDQSLYGALTFAGILCIVARTKIDLAVDDGFNDHNYSLDESLDKTRAALAEQLPDLSSDRLHLVTTRKKYWAGADEYGPFGALLALCEQLEAILRQCAEFRKS